MAAMQIRIDLERGTIERVGHPDPGSEESIIGRVRWRKPGDVIVGGYLDREKVQRDAPTQDTPCTVPDGHLWVMGDKRCQAEGCTAVYRVPEPGGGNE
jgi:hypothetical protein